ncbi:hypothetical protein NRIC_27080 [Enterococcus florum]|uniref:Uncharacterized protein n=1 Tax=Enterococcus florum TaxID=2480627 RepID=A0A4P5P9Q7_9ENTE|nr:hypothetical protein [Enterococcus florum]GCF94817.1 hypothetical protein NRIC_27080 [Enterococcus florum]
METIYQSSVLHGYCYTQLAGVEQEITVLLTYDQKPKCELSLIKAVNNQAVNPVIVS